MQMIQNMNINTIKQQKYQNRTETNCMLGACAFNNNIKFEISTLGEIYSISKL